MVIDAAYSDARSFLESSEELIEVHHSDTHLWLIVPKDRSDEVLKAMENRTSSNKPCEYCGRIIHAAGARVFCGECLDFQGLSIHYETDDDGEPIDFEAMSYQEYLKSPHWRAVREAKIKHASGSCACCGSTLQLHVHHRQYPKYRLDIKPDMLVVLCKRCHEAVHGVL
jgi:hypothetical protein